MWTCQQCGYQVADEENRFCGHCGATRADLPPAAPLGTPGQCDLYLLSIDPARKIEAIKVVRQLTGLGLKESLDLVEHTPQLLLLNVSREDADQMMGQLQFAGASGETRPASGQPGQPAVPARTAFSNDCDLYLLGFDPAKKIHVIKAVREITGLGLEESKDLVEHAPQPLLYTLAPADADVMVAKLQAAGAQVEATPTGSLPSRPVTPYMPGVQTTTGCGFLLLMAFTVLVSVMICVMK